MTTSTIWRTASTTSKPRQRGKTSASTTSKPKNEQLRERLDTVAAHLGIDDRAGQQVVADD